MTASTYALYDFFVAVAPSVMTHQLMSSFHMTSTDLGWIGASFFYAYALMQLPSGWMLERYGARRMLACYSLLSGFGLLLFALTSNYKVAMIARFLSGTGVCIGFLSSYYLAARWLHHRYFSTVAAGLHLLGTVGAILAQGPLARLVNQFGWRQTTLYLAMITILLAVLYALIIRDGYGRKNSQSIQLKQALTYCITHPQLRWIALVGFLAWLPFSTIGALWGVPYLINVFHWDNVTASHFCSLFWIGSGIGGFILCGISEKSRNRKKPMQVFFLIALLSSLVIVQIPTLSKILLLISMFSLGLSVTVQTMTFSLIKENVPQQYFSTASGLNNAVSMLSSAIGQAFIGMLLDWHRLNRGGTAIIYTISDYQCALGVIPIVAVLGLFVVTYKIKETHCLPMEKRDEYESFPQSANNTSEGVSNA